jgi:uncharacterized protein (TIGR02145 family)
MPVIARGVVWSINQNPTIPAKEGLQTDILKDTLTIKSDTLPTKVNKEFPKAKFSLPDTTNKLNTKTITTLTDNGGYTVNGSGTGTWVSELTQLNPATTYYVRAYSTTSAGTVYGNQQTFTTVAPTFPSITTNSITSITATTATSGGNITSDGGAAITARGVVWSTSQDPTTTTNQGITSNGTGTGSWVSELVELQPQTVYYVRAYATNSVGTVYGNQQNFTTFDGLPILTTTTATSITATTATSGGNITSDGGFAVTARGMVWSTSQNPTTTSNMGMTSNGTGIGTFTSNLIGLTQSTTYYVRAYATNSVGTTYGSQQSFTTQDGLPVITTYVVSSITATTAVNGGNITSDGGFSITARGVVWSTSQNPTTTSNMGMTNNGTGTGSYTSNLTNLQPGTVYYVRAYATNSVGTVYGNQQTFTTGTLPADVTNPTTGKVWLDRNLGASRVAQSSTDAEAYGDLYQWGRDTDGHEKKNSATTSTLSSSDTPGHSNFIIPSNSPDDWRTPQNNNLWQGVSGINNPCPTGYRVPTEAELNAERLSWSSNNSAGAFASPLKLTVAGYRYYGDGSLYGMGSDGVYWSSTIDGILSRRLYFLYSNASIASNERAHGRSVRCIKDGGTQVSLPTVTTTAITSIAQTTATGGGNVTNDGGAAVTARGVVWSTSQNPTTTSNLGITSNGTGTGTFTSNLTGLTQSTTYYVRAYATNSAGTSYGEQRSFTTAAATGTTVVDVTNPTTGKTWMDRNLGATRAATSSTDTEAYGDLYQWGRGTDGHEKRNSPTTSTLSSSDTPGHSNFIMASSSPYDWRSPQYDNLWQGLSGTNNPCPTGYRLPTEIVSS